MFARAPRHVSTRQETRASSRRAVPRTHAHPAEMDHPIGDHPAGLVVLLAAAVFARSTMIQRRTWDVPATALAVLPTDAAAIAEGGRLARIMGCHDCHGEHLEGRLFFSEPHVADLIAPNLSRLVPSLLGRRTGTCHPSRHPPRRHRPLRDAVGILLPPVRRRPRPADRPPPPPAPPRRRRASRRPSVRSGMSASPPAASSPCPRPWTTAPRVPHRRRQSSTAARGQYLARIACSECHGLTFGGGLEGKAPPLLIAAAYPDDAFRQLLRTGETPASATCI